MAELGLSITVGAALASSVASVVGGSVKHLDRLRNSVEAAEGAARDVAGYRVTGAALRAARERTAALRREMRQTAKPSQTLRRDFGRAAAESRRLATQLGRQSRALEEAGVDVRRLDVEERRLTRTLREQRTALARVEEATRRRDAARSRREGARGELVEVGALAYAAVRPLQAVVGAAVEFEEKMADVGKVVDFAAPDGLRLMGQDIRRLSKEIPVAASGLADIVAAAGQAGVAQGREALLQFAADTAKVAVAFDLAGAEAGEAMAGVRKVFGLGQQAAMDLAGAYNHLSNNLGASAPGLLKVGEVAGSNAQLIGLSARQLAALGTTLLDLKTPPAEAATALNSMFTKFANIETSTKQAQNALASVGLSASGLKQALRADAETAIVGFFEAVAKADNQAEVLSAIFGEDHGPKAAKIATGLETYAKARRLASSEQAAAASVLREYEIRSATTANAQILFRNRLNDLSIAVGDALLPSLNALLDVASPIVDALSFLADRFPVVTTVLVTATAGVILGKVALVAYRYAAGSVGEAVGTVRLAWERALPVRRSLTAATGRATSALLWHRNALAGVPAVGQLAAGGIGRATTAMRVFRMALVSTGVGAAVVAIGLAAQWLMANWEPVKAFFAGVGRGIGKMLDTMGPVGDVLRGIGTVIGDVLGWIGSLFAPVEASAETMERWGTAGETAGMAIGAAFRLALAPVVEVVGWAQKGLAIYRAWRGIGDEAPSDGAADSPPVRYRGRIWTRIGPRRAIAGAQDERILNEKRRLKDIPFDATPVRHATLADLDVRRFQYLYLPAAFDAEVLAQNNRTVEERLAATKMIVHADDPTPTVLGILTFACKPTDFLPGAYIQFLRLDGADRSTPILDNARVEGPLGEAMAEVDRIVRTNTRESVEIGTRTTEIRRSTYPPLALQELVRNAVMHRAYEGTNSPVQLYWFAEHIEIINPGGPYGDVTPENFGQPGLVDYRNPNLADAMCVTGLVQRYGAGLPSVREALRANEQPEPRFEVDAHWVKCFVTMRADWPGNLPGGQRRSSSS